MKVYNSGERRDVNNVTVLGSRNQAAQPKPRQTDCWQIYLIGTMRVVGPLGEDALPPRPRKIRALLASLCLTQPRGLSRNRIMALLWDKADRQARRNLRDALLQLNVLTGARARGLFKADDEHIALNRDVCWIDAFEAPIRSLETLLDDLDGISAPFDDWLDEQRRLFKGRVREALAGELTALIEEDASADRRASAAERLIAFDRLSEVGVAALMKAHADLGQHAQALRDYEEFGRALHDDLKLAPPREIEALAHSVRLASRGTRLQAQLAGGDPIRADQDAKPPVRGPSIAVLPFRNPSGKREHEFAAEGLTDVLTSNLSRVPGFFVISRQSALTFKKSARSASDIGDLLGVRYILSGSLRFLGSQIYLTVELADAAGGIILHSWQHQHRFAHLIEAQTELAEGIVREIAPHLRAAELKRTYAKRPAQLDAYDFLLRAQEAMHNSAAPVFAGAEQLFHEALQCDPSYAAVLAWLAYWHVLRVGQGWSPDPAGDAQLAREFAQRAVDCDPSEPMALAVLGHIATYLHKDFEAGFRHFDEARRFNPNAAPAWLWSAAANAWSGDGVRAVEEIGKAMALSPYDPLRYAQSAIASVSYLAAQQNERAVECAQRGIRQNASFTAAHKLLIIGLVLVGREEEARAAARRLLMIEPGFTVEKYRRHNPHISRVSESYYGALATAGVPLHA